MGRNTKNTKFGICVFSWKGFAFYSSLCRGQSRDPIKSNLAPIQMHGYTIKPRDSSMDLSVHNSPMDDQGLVAADVGDRSHFVQHIAPSSKPHG